MQDLAGLLDAHVCDGRCSRTTHSQRVLISPADVASVAAELRTLCEVRDLLSGRGLVMLEGEPTPRFGPGELDERKPWWVRYQPLTPAARPGSLRRGWLFGRR